MKDVLTMQDNQFSIHAIGNGHIIAYCHETDVIDYFGAPYSSPSLGTISLCRKTVRKILPYHIIRKMKTKCDRGIC